MCLFGFTVEIMYPPLVARQNTFGGNFVLSLHNYSMPCNRKKAQTEAEKKEEVKETKSKKEVKKETKPKKEAKKETKPKKVEKKESKPKVQKEKKPVQPLSAATERRHLLTTLAAEAIASNATEESPFVSSTKILEYIVKYIDTRAPTHENVKSLLRELVSKKLLQQRKSSVAFTKKGEEKLKPKSIPKRKENVPEPEEEPVEEKKPDVVTGSGRISRQVQY